MRFQVVMPSLNQGRYIGTAIESVLQQAKDVELELIVVDGASSDDSIAAVEAAASAHPDVPVVIVSEPDDGQADAINKGVALGSGDVVSWLNADDVLLPGTLERVGEYFRNPEIS